MSTVLVTVVLDVLYLRHVLDARESDDSSSPRFAGRPSSSNSHTAHVARSLRNDLSRYTQQANDATTLHRKDRHTVDGLESKVGVL